MDWVDVVLLERELSVDVEEDDNDDTDDAELLESVDELTLLCVLVDEDERVDEDEPVGTSTPHGAQTGVPHCSSHVASSLFGYERVQ